VVPIELPPLRARREDIPLLARYFAAKYAKNGMPVKFSPQTMQRLDAHDWPGNVRELRNVVERAVLLASRTGVVEPQHLPTFQPEEPAPDSGDAWASWRGREPTLDEIERTYLTHLLDKYNGNRRLVAEVLGVAERTAYRMLERHGMK
jgi:two-component system response regulator AtoC